MTTIACKAGQMAADTQLNGGDYAYRVQKIATLPDGSLVGGAGTWRNAYAGIKWMLHGEQGDPPSLEDATLLVLRTDGSVWMADGGWPLFPLMDKHGAIGMGAQVAMHAMNKGATAGEAVKAACEIDANTSGPVQMLALATPAKRRGR
jgi:hypothetical protein